LRIIIIGGGEVGFHLAKIFSKEGHQIVMIEPDREKISRVEESLDIMAVQGSGSSVETLVIRFVKVIWIKFWEWSISKMSWLQLQGVRRGFA